MSFIIEQDKSAVKHSNAMSVAHYSLTLNEKRLIALAIAKTSSSNISRTQSITVADFAKNFNLDKKSAYRQLEQAADNLFNNTIKFPKNNEEWRWITRKAIYKKGDGRVEFSFTPEILAHINGLKGQYTWYEISRISSMSSVYAVRIFEMMMAWRGVGKFNITIDELRARLDIENKYSGFGTFYKLILIPALQQIEDYAGYACQITQHKTGRKIASLTFVFVENPQQRLIP